jgi:hypothetical protein
VSSNNNDDDDDDDDDNNNNNNKVPYVVAAEVAGVYHCQTYSQCTVN